MHLTDHVPDTVWWNLARYNCDRLHFLPLQQVQSAKHGVHGLRCFPLQLCSRLGRCSQPSIAYIGCGKPLSYCSFKLLQTKFGKEVLAQLSQPENIPELP